MSKLPHILAVPVACALIAGCGGGTDVNKVLKQTFAGGQHVRSGKLDVTLLLTPKAPSTGSKPVKIELKGPFQTLGPGTMPHFDFTFSLTAGTGAFQAGAVSTGTAGYIRIQDRAYTVAPDVFNQFRRGFELASRQHTSKGNPSFHSLGVDPRSWLKNASVQGDEDVGGVSTQHVTADLDIARMLDDVTKLLGRASQIGLAGANSAAMLSPAQRDAFARAVSNPKFDLWTGKSDKIMRRMKISLSFKLANKASGLRAGDIVFTLEFDNVNQPQTISAPTGARPFSELASALRAIAGQLSILGGGSVSASGSSKSANLESYSSCLQAAGNDLRKAQGCARLLTP